MPNDAPWMARAPQRFVDDARDQTLLRGAGIGMAEVVMRSGTRVAAAMLLAVGAAAAPAAGQLLLETSVLSLAAAGHIVAAEVIARTRGVGVV